MSDKDRDHAAEQENSAANLANLDVDDAPLTGLPNAEASDPEGQADNGDGDIFRTERSQRKPQR